MTAPSILYVVTSFIWDDDYEKEGIREPEVYTTKSAANAGARKLMYRYADLLNPLGDRDMWDFHHNQDDEGLYRGTLEGGPGGHIAVEMCVYKITLNQAGGRETAKRPIPGPGNWTEGRDDDDLEEDENEGNGDEDDGDEGEDDESKKSTSAAKSSGKGSTATSKGKKPPSGVKPPPSLIANRKTIPTGIPNCLRGVRILFTGTFETMDRVTSIATAKNYGAEIVTKLEDTDYVVVGLRAGPKKLQVINELELETITEEEFFDVLENGVSKEKKMRMANKRKADEDEGPVKESQEKPHKSSGRAGTRKKAKK